MTFKTDSVTCWERAYVVRSHESTLWSLGCETACGLCIRITVHCAEPANPWLIHHASELLDSDAETQLMLTAVLLFPKPTRSRICFIALWNKLPGRAKDFGCPFDALVPRCTFYQSL